MVQTRQVTGEEDKAAGDTNVNEIILTHLISNRHAVTVGSMGIIDKEPVLTNGDGIDQRAVGCLLIPDLDAITGPRLPTNWCRPWVHPDADYNHGKSRCTGVDHSIFMVIWNPQSEMTFGYIQKKKYGVGWEVICKRFNHSSPSVTMRYLGIEDKEVNGILMNEI
jgi:hypothetical protein